MELWRKIYFKIFTVYTGTSLQKKKNILLDRLHVVLHQGKRIIWKCANRVPTLTHSRERIMILSKRLVKNEIGFSS